MIQLEITPEEREILFNLLQGCMADLHSEISHTDNYEYREMLKKRRAAMQKLADALMKSMEKPIAA